MKHSVTNKKLQFFAMFSNILYGMWLQNILSFDNTFWYDQ